MDSRPTILQDRASDRQGIGLTLMASQGKSFRNLISVIVRVSGQVYIYSRSVYRERESS